ncbi:MAG: hypothetical protein K0S68_1154 [Candidatus Saccharibacteria bacterium]|nr:hypothetical protein [Candidatus Saccharibacteria bacterium]
MNLIRRIAYAAVTNTTTAVANVPHLFCRLRWAASQELMRLEYRQPRVHGEQAHTVHMSHHYVPSGK